MLSNYLKISIAVLLRRRFLTFVNLFGAMLTLTVLIVAFAVFESTVSPAGAQHRQDRILTINRLRLSSSKSDGTWSTAMGPAFFDNYVATLETPDLISYSTLPSTANSYLDGRKITSQVRRTDADYWRILDFDVLDGRVLSADDVELGRFVAVVNEATAAGYFPDTSAVGKTITLGPDTFEVVGVVANEPQTSLLAFADIWVPATTVTGQRDAWIGDGVAMLYFEDRSRMAAARDEYQSALAAFEPISEPADLDRAASTASTALELMADEIIGPVLEVDVFAANELVAEFIAAAVVVVLLFMALPAINMANLNVGRILERAPEIGLRKATGASTRTLIGQFIFENVVLCTLGGLLAFAVSPIVLYVLNDTVFTYGRLALNVPVAVAGFVFILVFGVLSGGYPAWKMARLQPATCLRGLHHV